MPCKRFQNNQISKNTGRAQNLDFWSNFDPAMKMTKNGKKEIFSGKNLSIGLSKKNKNEKNEKYNNFLRYLGFFGVRMVPGSKIKRSRLSTTFLEDPY